MDLQRFCTNQWLTKLLKATNFERVSRTAPETDVFFAKIKMSITYFNIAYCRFDVTDSNWLDKSTSKAIAANSTPVGKIWLPCHDLAMIMKWLWPNLMMIMLWWRHGNHVSWHSRHSSWVDQGTITMFFKIHTRIMVYHHIFIFH